MNENPPTMYKLKVSVINKVNNVIVYHSHHFSTLVACSDTIVCNECQKPLRDIQEDEEWYRWLKKDHYYACPKCFILVKPIITEDYLKECDLEKKMPRKMLDVENDIRNHRTFSTIDPRIKQDFEGIIAVEYFNKSKRRSPDGNSDMRSIWYHIHHGKEYKPK